MRHCNRIEHKRGGMSVGIAWRTGLGGRDILCPGKNSLAILLGLLLCISVSGWARAEESFLSVTDGHLGLGGGTTIEYHVDNYTHAPLAAVTWTWDRDRFEVAAFRFLKAQDQDGVGWRLTLTNPDWIFEFSRRWTFFRTRIGNMFAGLGGAYKNEIDHDSGSRLNFAEQLGWRFTRSEVGPGFEVVVRHVSNAGLKKPNRGEDFITLAYVF
jgi:hypothetical protein